MKMIEHTRINSKSGKQEKQTTGKGQWNKWEAELWQSIDIEQEMWRCLIAYPRNLLWASMGHELQQFLQYKSHWSINLFHMIWHIIQEILFSCPSFSKSEKNVK